MPADASCSDVTLDTSTVIFVGEKSRPLSVPRSSPATASSGWSPSASSTLYKIDKWGKPYFSVNAAGNLSIHPHGVHTQSHQELDLLKIVKKAVEEGIQLPLIVRFPEVLDNVLNALQSAFNHAIKSQGYNSRYQGVFPVKSNQDRYVVEDIVKSGKLFHFGLEAGSKSELLLCMSSLCKASPKALLLCNGFKDAEYIKLALTARKLNLNAVIVLEQEEELDLVIHELTKDPMVECVLGLRAKLRTMHSGHFGSTSGENGKFGLNPKQILRIVEKLKGAKMLDRLELLHFHIGSQIPSTRPLADASQEAAQIYCALVRSGARMKYIDIGGGLGIDYDGSKSNSEFSVEYGLDDYASAVVQAIKSTCDEKSVNHPVICSESGRAIVSHHSILIFEASSASVEQTPDKISSADPEKELVEALTDEGRDNYNNLVVTAKVHADYKASSTYANDLKHICADQFRDGTLSFALLAAVDGICEKYLKECSAYDPPVRVYNINLSLFTSYPDYWGIGQVFPIIPIHRLDQRPTSRGNLYDLTGDSDGKIVKFIGNESSLLLHDPEDKYCGKKYYLGMFLAGAYQESLGGLHSLFGRPSVLQVTSTETDGVPTNIGFVVKRRANGMSCGDVLKAMQYKPEDMLQTLKDRAGKCGATDVDVIRRRLDHSFHRMPYLVTDTNDDE